MTDSSSKTSRRLGSLQARGSRYLWRSMFALMLGAGVIGCGASWVPYQPKTISASESPDALYAATIRVFLRRGYGLVSRDPSARAVETDYIEWPGMVRGSRVYLAYRVIVNSGSLEIFTSCKKVLEDCPESERPEGLDQLEAEIAREISAEASRL